MGIFGSWETQDFRARIDEWVERDSPSPAMRQKAISWACSRALDPYQGAGRLEHMGEIYWIARLPTPPDESISVVGGLLIDEVAHTVRCTNIQTVPPEIVVL